jgi:hypothetical protein
VLFTAAGTPIFLLNSERLFGGDELVIRPDGTYQVASKRGMLERAARSLVEAIAQAVLGIACLFGALISVVMILRSWKFPRRAETHTHSSSRAKSIAP